jgi:hypothetical protein
VAAIVTMLVAITASSTQDAHHGQDNLRAESAIATSTRVLPERPQFVD